MDKNKRFSEGITINLAEIGRYLLKRSWLILASGMVMALSLILSSMMLAKPSYESSTKIYILSNDDTNSLTTSDMTVSSSLTKDYAEILTSRTVVDRVISKLQLNATFEDFVKKVDVSSSSSDTRILTITVTDNDPYEAKRLVDAFRDTAVDQITDVMGKDMVKVIENANYPDHRSSPSLKKSGLLGGIVGVFLCCVILLIVYMKNDTLRTQNDVERYLGITVLGMIPSDSKLKKINKKTKRSRKKQNINEGEKI